MYCALQCVISLFCYFVRPLFLTVPEWIGLGHEVQQRKPYTTRQLTGHILSKKGLYNINLSPVMMKCCTLGLPDWSCDIQTLHSRLRGEEALFHCLLMILHIMALLVTVSMLIIFTDSHLADTPLISLILLLAALSPSW